MLEIRWMKASNNYHYFYFFNDWVASYLFLRTFKIQRLCEIQKREQTQTNKRKIDSIMENVLCANYQKTVIMNPPSWYAFNDVKGQSVTIIPFDILTTMWPAMMNIHALVTRPSSSESTNHEGLSQKDSSTFCKRGSWGNTTSLLFGVDLGWWQCTIYLMVPFLEPSIIIICLFVAEFGEAAR